MKLNQECKFIIYTGCVNEIVANFLLQKNNTKGSFFNFLLKNQKHVKDVCVELIYIQ